MSSRLRRAPKRKAQAPDIALAPRENRQNIEPGSNTRKKIKLNVAEVSEHYKFKRQIYKNGIIYSTKHQVERLKIR